MERFLPTRTAGPNTQRPLQPMMEIRWQMLNSEQGPFAESDFGSKMLNAAGLVVAEALRRSSSATVGCGEGRSSA